jgi:hypothetical protein
LDQGCSACRPARTQQKRAWPGFSKRANCRKEYVALRLCLPPPDYVPQRQLEGGSLARPRSGRSNAPQLRANAHYGRARNRHERAASPFARPLPKGRPTARGTPPRRPRPRPASNGAYQWPQLLFPRAVHREHEANTMLGGSPNVLPVRPWRASCAGYFFSSCHGLR